jgi:subtilisin family serine protease
MYRPSFGTKSASTRLALTFSFLIAVTLFIVTALPPASRATQDANQSDVKQKQPRPEFVPGEVLVRYRSERIADRQPRTATLNVKGRQVGINVERFDGSNIVPGLRIARVAAADTLAAIEALKQHPDVLYAEPNYLLYLDATPNDPRFVSNELYGLLKIGAPTAWNTTTGNSSVVVAVIDEGIDKLHPDLQANIWTNPAEVAGNGIDDDGNGFIDDVNGYNFAGNTGTIPAENHATHVAGTIGAIGNNNTGVVGVNWQVRLMSLKFIDGSSGSTADSIRACNYSRQMHDLWVSTNGVKGANVRVLNNSYGGGGFSQSFFDAINALNQSGILFVAAAGNAPDSPEPNNDLVPHYPSGYDAPNVISVAATDSNDALASFSHFGATSVDLGAPGVGILSTTANNTYSFFNGTSMATPHVAGAAALLLAQNPNLTVQKLKSLLIFNGDPVSSLAGKTLTGRRLDVANSFQALAENDITPPGTVSNFHVNSQTGRTVNLGWTASGDNDATGQASLYQLSYMDAFTGKVIPLTAFAPPTSGTPQTLDVKVPYGHTKGTFTLQEFDNVGNEGTPASVNVIISFLDGNPYATAVGVPAALSTGGTALNLIGDDKLLLNYALPFSFPFFGQNLSQVTISTNGNLFFSAPPTRSNGDADDVPGSAAGLAKFKMISGLWDDLRTDGHPGDDVYVVIPDSNRIIFRWQAVIFGDGSNPANQPPVNFEIELRNDGTIKTRYGTGQSAPTNTNIFPVVGISGGEPDAYVIGTHTSELNSTSLTNALSVSYLPRGVVNPLGNSDFYVDQHYSDFLNRVPDVSGLGFWTNQINECGTDQTCIDIRRINVSAAFFLSIEFLETGYLVERLYKSAYGDALGTSTLGGSHQLLVPIIRRGEFLPDMQLIGQGLVVGQAGWEQVLENNKQTFIADFVSRARFTTLYPVGMPPAQFVDTLNTNAGNPLSQSERDALINDLTTGAKSRAQVLRAVAEDPDLFNAEKNRAFVLTQYYGYLRRNPNEGQDTDYTGYDFWLTKLNQFGGNFVNAEMVKAFILSGEYRGRFGP